MLALSALEYTVLAPAALISAIFLTLHEQISDALTLPWLAVIPGALVAVWLTSPTRARQYSDPGDGGAIRRGFAHTVAGLSILRSLLLSSPREHGLGLLGVVTYRIFNFWLPMVPAVAVLPTIAELRAEFAQAERDIDRESGVQERA